MIVQEKLSGGLVRTYSDAGFFIHGGYPENDYADAIDFEYLHRTYTETTTPIPKETEEQSEDTETAAAEERQAL